MKNLPPIRAWQESALALWLRSQRGIVAAVTGAGKTTLGLLCIDAWRRQHANGIICIIVPTTALLDQWLVTLTDDFGVDPKEIAMVVGGKRHIEGATFIIAVINSARPFSEFFSFSVSTMLIVDECHRAGSQENAKALRGAWWATLGLSATPERDYDDGFYSFVAPALGKVIYRYDYAAALWDGVVVPFDLINVHFDLSE